MPYFLHQSNDFQEFIPFLSLEILRKATIFEPAVLVVQNKALEHWLKSALSEHLGLCMALEFHTQESVIPKILAYFSGSVKESRQILSADALEFRLFHLLGRENISKEPLFLPLGSYLDSFPKPSRAGTQRRKQLAKQLSLLFSSYEKTRPEILECWKKNSDFFPPESEQAASEAWQKRLWRWVYEETDAGAQSDFFELISKNKIQPGKLLPWMGIFGSTFLLEETEKIFLALANQTDIHRFWWNPSAGFWGDALSGRQQARNPNVTGSVHPMLENWGRLGRNQQRFFLDQEGILESEHFRDTFPETLLGRVQSGILTLEETPEPLPLAEDDDSVKVFSCVGKRREVEVLHDQLLKLLERHPDLRLTDIGVSAPKIEEYAGLIDLVFGNSGTSKIPHHILSANAFQESDFLKGVSLLLDLSASRFSPKSVFPLLRHPCFLKRHGLSPEDLEILRSWALKLPIKMGWSAEHRGALGFPGDPQHTWEEGFTRLWLGFAMSVEQPPKEYEGVFPFPVPVSELETESRLLHVLHSLGEDLRKLARFSGTFQDWIPFLRDCVSANLALRFDHPEDGSALLRFEQSLTSFQDMESSWKEKSEPLDFPAFHSFMKEALESEAVSHKGSSGNLVFSSLRTLRATPFRVTVLLGMNEGAFPALDPKISFDLRPHSQRPLDATQRDVDLYSFLEALAGTREKFWIFYSGKNPENLLSLRPALPVQDLLDFYEKHFCSGIPLPLRKPILEEHPLHSFDSRYFKEGHPLFSLDASALKSAQGRGLRFQGPSKKTNKDKLAVTPGKISLESLERFLKSPAEAFFREALNLKLDEIPEDSNGLENWEIERRSLFAFDRETVKRSTLADGNVAGILGDFVKTETFSGQWPKGVYGEIAAEFLEERGRLVLEQSRKLGLGNLCEPFRLEGKMPEVVIPGREPLVLTGVLSSFFEKGFLSVAVDSKTPKFKQHRNAWLRYLLLRNLDPDNRYEQMISVVLSPHPDGKASKICFKLSQEEAREMLRGLLEAFLFNLQEVLPVYFECCETICEDKREDLLDDFDKAVEWCEYSRLYFKTSPDFEDETLFKRLGDFARLFYGKLFSSEKVK